MIGRYVIVRTEHAGVHHGILVEDCERVVVLKEASILWKWNGAKTLHEVSLYGPAENSNISEPVPEISLRGVIEVIPCSKQAETNLRRHRWKA